MRCAYLVQLDQRYPSQKEDERRREDVNLIKLKKRHDCGGVALGFGWETAPTKDLRAARRGKGAASTKDLPGFDVSWCSHGSPMVLRN